MLQLVPIRRKLQASQVCHQYDAEQPNTEAGWAAFFDLQAHAWMALGKVCLVDELLAKKCILAFVHELQAARAPAVSRRRPPALEPAVWI